MGIADTGDQTQTREIRSRRLGSEALEIRSRHGGSEADTGDQKQTLGIRSRHQESEADRVSEPGAG